jgi:hypothetical protein
MSAATQVFYTSSLVPATATGWASFDIDDYAWYGVDNLIIDILWGDNGYYNSTYYRTLKTDGGVTRTLLGYADSETPPNYDAATTYFDNIRMYYDILTAPGDIEGYVFNYDGLTISGATVGIEGMMSTTTAANGYYLLTGVPAYMTDVYCYKAGYNPAIASVNVQSGLTVQQDFTLTQPNMIVNPLSVEQTVNPNEYFTMSMSVLNNGNGPLAWTAIVQYPEVDFPHYSLGNGAQINYGSVSDPMAFSRSSAHDQVVSTGSRDFGDILLQWPAPSPIGLVWGAGHDGTNLWFTDPNLSATTIYQVTPDGVNTGNTITLSLGQTWIGDMASDGDFLYCCLVGGPNTIAKIDLSDGSLVGTITGAWTVISQRDWPMMQRTTSSTSGAGTATRSGEWTARALPSLPLPSQG